MKKHLIFSLTCFFLIFLGLLTTILTLNHGQFSYALDDAYIHLSVSNTIFHGGYGLQLFQYSSPSSSIIWPFILAPFASDPIHSWLPLIINIMITAFAMLILDAILSLADNAISHAYKALLILLLLFCFNGYSLIFIGLEHSLQVCLSLSLLYGLLKEPQSKALPNWFWLIVIVSPLIRYENAILSGLICLYGWYLGYRKQAASSLISFSALLLAFSMFLSALGLTLMPSSIIVKSAGAQFWLASFKKHLTYLEGLYCLGLSVAILAKALLFKSTQKEQIISVLLSLNAIVFLFIGGMGWFFRYEMYIIATNLAFLVYLVLKYRKLNHKKNYWLTLLGLLLFASPYIKLTTELPIASNNIYQQQFHLRQFILNYVQKPVAIHDIGWVSYKNPNFILDLWGVNDVSIYENRTDSHNLDWLNEAINQHKIALASVFETTLQNIPPEWKLIDCIGITRKQIVLPENPVYLYATKPEYYPWLKQQFNNFKKTIKEPEIITECHKL